MVVAARDLSLIRIIKKGFPDRVECSLVPLDSVMPSIVPVSSEVMAALLFLAQESSEMVTAERLIEVLRQIKSPEVFYG